MKHKIKIATNSSEIQCLYSQNWEYYDYGNCKRHLQILFPYKSEMRENKKYPLILFIPGSAWHKQEMYKAMKNWQKRLLVLCIYQRILSFHQYCLCTVNMTRLCP